MNNFSYYFFNNPLTNQLTIDKINAPQNAGQKPATKKPSTKLATNQNSKAFITNVNSPSVKMFTGNVRITKTGFMTAFTKPKIKAAIKAAYQPLTVIPGK